MKDFEHTPVFPGIESLIRRYTENAAILHKWPVGRKTILAQYHQFWIEFYGALRWL